MNAHVEVPKTIDAILDELVIRRSTGPDAMAQRIVEGHGEGYAAAQERAVRREEVVTWNFDISDIPRGRGETKTRTITMQGQADRAEIPRFHTGACLDRDAQWRGDPDAVRAADQDEPERMVERRRRREPDQVLATVCPAAS
jgi:hypothetical protein